MNDESVIKDPETGQITAIKIKVPPYNPELDPDSPEFDPVKYREAVKSAMEQLPERMEKMRERFDQTIQRVSQMWQQYLEATQAAEDANSDEELREVARTAKATLEQATEAQQLIPAFYEAAYGTIRQGTATNALTKIRPVIGENAVIDPITKATTIDGGNITITLPYLPNSPSFQTSTHRLFDMITEAFTENGAKDPRVSITLSDYMENRGLKDRKEARKQVEQDLEALRVAAISFTEKRRKGEPIGYYNMNISGGAGISKKGIITFTFSEGMYKLLLSYAPMPIPRAIYRGNDRRNPNSYFLLRKIAEHKNMNVGKKNEDIISVKTLLKAAPYIPSYQKVMKSDRHVRSRIIDPFERDMDALSATVKWEYCHTGGIPLTADELRDFPYHDFINGLIHISWEKYPDQSRRLAKIKAAREKKTLPKKRKSSR